MKQEIDNKRVLLYGGGVNSVALLIEATEKGIIFDAILFADTGGERAKTYKHVALMSEWCKAHGQPEITTLKQVNKNNEFVGLYQDSINNKSLPSIAYGFKTCSQKFKKFPVDKYLNNCEWAEECWKKGGKIFRYVGFDADESHRTQKDWSDDRYTNIYLLVEWGWGRFECIKRIIDSGLPLPSKSSCTYCPSMKPLEIIELYENDREEFYKAVKMERNANLTAVKGLGRSFSWWDLILAYRYLSRIKKAKGYSAQIPVKIKKLMQKINKAKEINLKDGVKPAIGNLFQTSINISCDCYDG